MTIEAKTERRDALAIEATEARRVAADAQRALADGVGTVQVAIAAANEAQVLTSALQTIEAEIASERAQIEAADAEAQRAEKMLAAVNITKAADADALRFWEAMRIADAELQKVTAIALQVLSATEKHQVDYQRAAAALAGMSETEFQNPDVHQMQHKFAILAEIRAAGGNTDSMNAISSFIATPAHAPLIHAAPLREAIVRAQQLK